MHESEQRGKLLLNGNKIPDDALARLLGLDKQALTKTVETLLSFGVAFRDPDTGAISNRRMIRDEQLRAVRKECGKMGGNPSLLNQTAKQNGATHLKQKTTPSFSLSSSSSSSRLKALPRGAKSKAFERRMMGEIKALLGIQFENDAGKWRNRLRDNPEKVERVFAEVRSMATESRIVEGPAQASEDLWKRFA